MTRIGQPFLVFKQGIQFIKADPNSFNARRAVAGSPRCPPSQLKYVIACAITMIHLSRFCEDIVLCTSEEFGFIKLAEAWSTGSSIMPQPPPILPNLFAVKRAAAREIW
ncbi:MAG: hypothetical protein LBG95_04610 [Treponema sp.]|nr:hypothetical protein [Treponema sp.]